MEYFEGETLPERLRGGPMSTKEVVDTGVQVADAIDAAHAKGITHRDLKPANIMITSSVGKWLNGYCPQRPGAFRPDNRASTV